jgi:hypothetical protein
LNQPRAVFSHCVAEQMVWSLHLRSEVVLGAAVCHCNEEHLVSAVQ